MKVEIHWFNAWPDIWVLEVREWPTYLWLVFEDDLYNTVFTEYQMRKYDEWEYSFDLNKKLLLDSIHYFKIKFERMENKKGEGCCPWCWATTKDECCSFWKLHALPPK